MPVPRARSLLAAGLALLLVAPLACKKAPRLFLDSPGNGLFTTAPSVLVTGHVAAVELATSVLRVNGVVVPIAPDATWSTSVPLDPVALVNPIVAELTLANGRTLRERVTVIAGDGILDGEFSPMGVAMRLDDSGLDALEPQISSLVDFDPATLLAPDTQVINDYCAIDGGIFGCWGSVDVEIGTPAPSISGFGIGVDAQAADVVDGDITISNLVVNLDIIGSGLAPSCGLEIKASTTLIDGSYGLQPEALDPTLVDVFQNGFADVNFTNYQQTFTSGLCDFPLIGDLIQLIIGNVEPVVEGGFEDFLNVVDAAGNTPVAGAIETALTGVEIAGPIGQAIGVNLEAPLFDVYEDAAGITLDSDARVTALFPDPDAVDQLASYHVDEPFPVFGPASPGGFPYGIGIAISTSAFNQLLKAEVESGLLISTLTEVTLGGTTIPLTAGFLASIAPEFGALPPGAPMEIELLPTLAPFLTGTTGPAGELAELRLAHLLATLRIAGDDHPLLVIAVDATFGLDLDLQGGALSFGLGDLAPGSLEITFLTNQLSANEFVLDNVLGFLLPQVLPTLATSLGSFPLPDFFGLQLVPVEVTKSGEYLSIYADLVAAP